MSSGIYCTVPHKAGYHIVTLIALSGSCGEPLPLAGFITFLLEEDSYPDNMFATNCGVIEVGRPTSKGRWWWWLDPCMGGLQQGAHRD